MINEWKTDIKCADDRQKTGRRQTEDNAERQAEKQTENEWNFGGKWVDGKRNEIDGTQDERPEYQMRNNNDSCNNAVNLDLASFAIVIEMHCQMKKRNKDVLDISFFLLCS